MLIVYEAFTIHGDNPPMMDFINRAFLSSNISQTLISNSLWRTVSHRCCSRSNPEWTRRHLRPSLYRLNISIPVPEYRCGWYGNLHRTQKHGFQLYHCAAHKGFRSIPCGAHIMRFFSVIVVMMSPAANSKFYRLNVWFLAAQPSEHLLSYKLGIVRCCLTMPSQTVEKRTHMIIAFRSFSI